MEEDLYHAGAGKEGLIIDVRFNGGGSTADHVMTALTQPVHAITRSRGSGEGYPQDRRVYASWTRPIVLMCNEHSFSNAEIVSHAIKQTGRGRVVGMRTAGGVISTGSASLMDKQLRADANSRLVLGNNGRGYGAQRLRTAHCLVERSNLGVTRWNRRAIGESRRSASRGCCR